MVGGCKEIYDRGRGHIGLLIEAECPYLVVIKPTADKREAYHGQHAETGRPLCQEHPRQRQAAMSKKGVCAVRPGPNLIRSGFPCYGPLNITVSLHTQLIIGYQPEKNKRGSCYTMQTYPVKSRCRP